MKLPEESDNYAPQINIVPMIDVIFAILTFFIVSTLYLTKNQGVPVNLPTAITGEIQQQSKPVTVTIDNTGQIYVNQKVIALENLQAQIKPLIPPSQTTTLVIINADEKVSHGKVVKVMDKLRGISGIKLAIATEKP